MRIVAGIFKGHRLSSPSGTETRPTADRVREAIFNILGSPPDSCMVLDLFAGTGALGLEALSRGAVHTTFVEQNKASIRTIKENVLRLRLQEKTTVLHASADQALQRIPGPFTWIFVDPPYYRFQYAPLLEILGEDSRLLCDDSVVIVEHPCKENTVLSPPQEKHGTLERTDRRIYGQTAVSFYRPTYRSYSPRSTP